MKQNKGATSMKTPILETKRLQLRPLTVADAQEIFKNWTNDESVARFMPWDLHKTLEDTIDWLKMEEKELEGESYCWAFILKETGEIVGSGGLNYNETNGHELGYNFMKTMWGKGLASEVSREIIRFGKEADIKHFYGRHAEGNEGSKNVLKKLGFVFKCEGKFISLSGKKRFDSREYTLDV